MLSVLTAGVLNPWVEMKINLRFNPCSDDRGAWGRR